MKTIRMQSVGAVLLALAALGSGRAAAQEAPQPVVYSGYYECNPNLLGRADSLVRAYWAPAFDRQVSAGNATAWGWLTHHTGSTWSRAFYLVSPDVGKAVAAVDALGRDSAVAANPRGAEETSAACPRHEDYIWQRVAGSQPTAQLGANRPAASLSIYYECNMGREERADAIVNTAFAPILNAAVQRGDFVSWGWLQHLVGGKYRRLLVTDGSSAGALATAVGRLSADLRSQQRDAHREFHEICPAHQDVIWGIMAR